ncbi:MAG: nuclear transport factor 2 family protein [Alphaproteobacteria bacterium]|nr:nuclear transport factor 2 family protein [Alphaproteobacteria bacterium]
MFVRYSLRTTDLPGALRFYAEALGLDLPPGPAPGPLEVWPLHENARARGVPAHWLGHVAVDDPVAVRDAVVAAGGEALGPLVEGPNGRYAAVRDPGGAVLAASTAVASGFAGVWPHLHAPEVDAAARFYGGVFGWAVSPGAGPHGRHAVSWRGGEASLAPIRSPGIHPHWLYFFPVDDPFGCAARVRALGGTAMEPVVDSEAVWVACEDPQGAAFGIRCADPALAAVVAFDAAIAARDLGALVARMTPDHRFVDSGGGVVEGRDACRGAWEGFFGAFPDYRNVFERVVRVDGRVIALGHSECSTPALAGPAIWSAVVRDGALAEWRVDDDTPEVRARMGLGGA